MGNTLDLLEALEHIDPAALSYQEWVNVGMGLKEAGYSASDWENLEPPGWKTLSRRRVSAKMGDFHRNDYGADYGRHCCKNGYGYGVAARRLPDRP